MRRVLLFLIILIFPLGLSAQWFGNGLTSGTAYYGVINGANPMQTWNTANYPDGIIYVGRLTAGQNDLEVGTGGTLAISSGITVKFCTAASDLRISGTGILTAIGTASVPVVFTKNIQATWGHISFEASTGSSVITYCTIEYGSKNGVGIEGYGGGIHANTSNLAISYSTIQNNYAKWGGGIFVNKNQNPSISNCIIKNNTASTGGGGINFWNGSFSVVTNCLIYQNNVTSATIYGGGGVFIGPASGAVRIINCTFAGNSAAFRASEAYFDSSPSARIINSILWGTNTPYYGTTSSTFVYCAIQAGFPSGSVGCIILNSLNNDVAGPNFAATNGSDWSIKFISPCRDAGVNTYPGVTIPPLDYIGNGRIGPTDIGAYEVILSRWLGTLGTNWNDAANWQGSIPVLSMSDVIIPSGATNYPTVSSSQDYTVGPGKYMIVEAGAKVTLGTLTNNGTLNLQSSATGIFSLNMNSYAGTGVANIGMYLTGGGGTNAWKWHYVAVPAYLANKTAFTSINADNLMLYDESQIPNKAGATDNAGWMWHDGYAGTIGFSDLILNRGYSFYHANPFAVVNFTNLSSLETSIGSLPLQYSGTGKLDPTLYGFNLLGNSLTCSLDWNKVTESDPIIRDAVYYTINYKIGSYVRNAGGINGATKDIPPLQGFLVKTSAINTSLDFSNAKEHSGQQRYKKGLEVTESDSKGSGSDAPMIKLELNNSGNQDETLIWLNDNATNGFDGNYDATKMFAASGAYDQIYTLAGTDKLGISGIPYPTEPLIIPIALKLRAAGTDYKIITSEFQGLDGYRVTLTDKENSNFTIDLFKNSIYSFSSAAAGTFTNRFVLTISTIITALPEEITTDKSFNVYVSGNELNIQPLENGWNGKTGSINVFDLMGRRVLQQNKVEWNSGDIRKISMNVQQGMYIVEINTEYKRFVYKINIVK